MEIKYKKDDLIKVVSIRIEEKVLKVLKKHNVNMSLSVREFLKQIADKLKQKEMSK